MNNQQIIRTRSVSYQYDKKVKTLVDINLQVEQGSIYGFLGPNGSGKTTMLSLLLGLLNQQEGTIELFGHELNKHKTKILKQVGPLIETPSLYGHLTARENLRVYRRLYSAPKDSIELVLKLVGLYDTGDKVIDSFSLGMKQRLAIALALLHNPALLILDEPINGMDPMGITELRMLLSKLNKEE